MILGIDLGTTNSLVGAMDAGFPVLFADAAGRRLMPSAVAARQDGTIAVGHDALATGQAVTSVKRLIGTGTRVTLGGQGRSAEEVSAVILGALKSLAERAMEAEMREAVITVPAYFNDAQRAATKRAGELAGLEVRRLLAEPTAAALAYGLDKLGERSKVAVFDLGGGTFDISILELAEGVFHVLSTHGDTRLGGDDFDAAIAEKLGVSREAAKAAKEEQSEIRDPNSPIDGVCLPILERTRGYCLRALADANLEPADLDEVILVGGATRMPLVRRFVAEVFGREPNTSQHPDEAVALGAVLQAGILEGSVKNVTLLDVTPLSLGIETFGGLMNVLIPRNTTIPVKKGEMFTNAVANQRAMRIAVLQGERELAKDNWKLGEFDLEFTPAPKGQARVGVQFEIDANGILNVLARDVATQRDTIIEIRSAVDVADEAVEKMIGDSVEHAFEDMADRQLAEAKLKAEEMLPAIDAAYAQLGDRISTEERARIDALVHRVREAAAEGHLQKLKKLLTELDDATQDLAILLLESLSGDK